MFLDISLFRKHYKNNVERMDLVFRLVFKTSSGRIIPAVAGSIPALSDSYKTAHGR